MNFLGKYSFGMYVYHPLILYVTYKINFFNFIDSEILRLIVIFIIVSLLTILISFLSYELFEKVY